MKANLVLRIVFLLALTIGVSWMILDIYQTSELSPIVTSVGLKDIQTVPFPAVTVCFPHSGRWMSILEALNHYDTEGEIFNLIKQQDVRIHELFSVPFTGPTETAKNSFDPDLLHIDGNLPKRLNFSQGSIHKPGGHKRAQKVD